MAEVERYKPRISSKGVATLRSAARELSDEADAQRRDAARRIYGGRIERGEIPGLGYRPMGNRRPYTLR